MQISPRPPEQHRGIGRVRQSSQQSQRASSMNQCALARSTLPGQAEKQQLHTAPASIFRANLAFQVRTCDEGHRLQLFLCDVNTRICNECSRLLPDVHTFRCQQCDFDLCRRCFARPGRAQLSAERSTSKSKGSEPQKQRSLRKAVPSPGIDATSPRMLYGILPPVRLAARFQAPRAPRPIRIKPADEQCCVMSEHEQQAEVEEKPLGPRYSRSASVVSGTATPASQDKPIVCDDIAEQPLEGQCMESHMPVAFHLSKTEQWRMATAFMVAATMGKKDFYRVGPPSPVRRKHWQC